MPLTGETRKRETHPMRRPENPVHAGNLVDQGQRETERMDGRRPLGFWHVGRIFERIRVVHVLYAARERHNVVGGKRTVIYILCNFQTITFIPSLRTGYIMVYPYENAFIGIRTIRTSSGCTAGRSGCIILQKQYAQL